MDDVTFLYMDIRLRHQRNKTTVGRWLLHILQVTPAEYLVTAQNCSAFGILKKRYATGRPILSATPPLACHEGTQPGCFFSWSADLALGVLAGQVLLAPFLLVAILIVALDKKLMQGQPSRLGWTVVAITTVAMFAARVAMFVV